MWETAQKISDRDCREYEAIYKKAKLERLEQTAKELQKEIGQLKRDSKEVTYKIGQRFRYAPENVSNPHRYIGYTSDDDTYILSKPEKGKACLINLVSGNRFKDALSIEHYNKVTQKEFNFMGGDLMELIAT